MIAKLLLLIACVSVALAGSQVPKKTDYTSFSATVEIRSAVKPGNVIKAGLKYDFSAKKMRWEYYNQSDAVIFTETVDYKLGIKFKQCTDCESYLAPTEVPEYFTKSTDLQPKIAPRTIGGKKCFLSTKSKGPVGRVWATAEGEPCEVVHRDNVITFLTYKPETPAIADPSNLCPKAKCSHPLDLVIVMDETGSISDAEWAIMKQWAVGLVNEFEISATSTNVGVAYFSGRSFRPHENPETCCGIGEGVLPLNPDKATVVNTINGHFKKGGHTCIGCGIREGQKFFPNPRRTPRNQVMVVLTDGFNNRESKFLQPIAEEAKAKGTTIFAVGVGSTFSLKQLRMIASDPIKGVFVSKTYAELALTIKGLVKGMCTTFVEDSCGQDCAGLCSCKKTCICPTKCESDDKCNPRKCVTGAFGSKCKAEAITCPTLKAPTNTNKPDLCKENKCVDGKCVASDVTCKFDKTKCETAKCTPETGCQITQCKEDPTKPCEVVKCDATKGCIRTPRDCALENTQGKCAVPKCDLAKGCVFTPVVCDDKDPCTNDVCDPEKGCVYTKKEECKCECPKIPCHRSSCDKNGKCIQTPMTCTSTDPCVTSKCENDKCVTVADKCPQGTDRCIVSRCIPEASEGGDPFTCISQRTTCDDGNRCTEDACDPATGQCTYKAISCPGTNGVCQTSKCDPQKGCVVEEKKCDDGKPCTQDYCNSEGEGCETIPVRCTTTTPCTTAVCDPLKGCTTLPVQCAAPKDVCHTNTCDEATGKCVERVIPGTIDACNRCNGDPLTCNPAATVPPASLAPGVVAGVVIGSAVAGGAAALGIGAAIGKSAGAAPAVMSNASTLGAVNNPLFDAAQAPTDNPLFQG